MKILCIKSNLNANSGEIFDAEKSPLEGYHPSVREDLDVWKVWRVRPSLFFSVIQKRTDGEIKYVVLPDDYDDKYLFKMALKYGISMK